MLHIESSRGSVFKNNAVSTVLSVVIYHGKERIEDAETLRKTFGSGAYIQWKWQRLEEETYGIISSAIQESETMDFHLHYHQMM